MRSENFTVVSISKHEIFEKALSDALQREGEPFVLVDFDKSQVFRSCDRNWTKLFYKKSDSSFLRKRELLYLMEGVEPSRGLSVGIEASNELAVLFPELKSNDVILTISDLGFRVSRHRERMTKLQSLFANFSRIYFEDQYLFFMAGDKGSKIPHFYLDIDPPPNEGVTLSQLAKSIGVIKTPDVTSEQCASVTLDIRRILPDYHVRLLDEADILSSDQIDGSNELRMDIQNKVGDLTGLIFIGYSRNSLSLLKALSPRARSATVCGDNYHLRCARWNVSEEIPLVPVYQLATVLADRLRKPDVGSEFVGRGTVISQLTRIENTYRPPYYEDLALHVNGPLDIFFSVTPIETHSSGARAQRVRNMNLAIRSATRSVIELSASPNSLDRRMKLIQSLLESGLEAGIFYGENSTTPVRDIRILASIERLVKLFKERGGKAGWFIRDLHFMDPKIWDQGGNQDLGQWAKLEFNVLSDNMDLFFAPTDRAADLFKRYLDVPSSSETKWHSLPPGMSGVSLAPTAKNSEKNITFVYSGGLGPIYKMDRFLSAVRELGSSEDINFDFVVREAECHHLDEIRSSCQNIRVLNHDFDYYKARSRHVVGVALLDMEYADAGFPVKVINYTSRSIPILCFSGSEYSNFVSKNNIGWVVERGSPVLAVLKDLARKASRSAPLVPVERFKETLRTNAWSDRADFVRKSLSRSL